MNGDGAARRFERDLSIVNKRGLHARAAAKFVQTVERFEAKVVVSKDGHSVDGDSMMGLLMLGAAPGTSIHVVAQGRDATPALEAISTLVANRFGEES
jgi:phosphocarrier protein HPr